MVRKYTASDFMDGASLAVRLPEECRSEGSSVRVWKEGSRVILEPETLRDWPAGFWEKLDALDPLPDDFALPEPLPENPYRDEVLEWFSGE